MLKKIKPYILPYLIGIALPLGIGLLSAFLTRGNMDIYSEVKTPPLSPPPLLFPIVWTLLYILMGVSSTLVYLSRERNISEARSGLVYYLISLVFNFFWGIIFFNLRSYLFSFVWLLGLLYFIINTVLCYRKVNKVAAYFQIPYIIWVIFAGYLNFGIWFLNK